MTSTFHFSTISIIVALNLLPLNINAICNTISEAMYFIFCLFGKILNSSSYNWTKGYDLICPVESVIN